MPKKFSFPLENILKYRRKLQDNKMLKLHQTKMELQAEQEKLTDIKAFKEGLLNNGRLETPQKLDLVNRKIYNEFVGQVNDSINKQNRAVNVSKRKVIKATEELDEETKRKKILEKLKERHLEKFKVDQRRKEEKDNSEVALRKSYFGDR
ncbi:MAG: flagellar FliJ family protein [Candidatus Marinimicrobia bacterium]|nr:flagellar FliJ family protein [Candidatus Neomarinimicrobiota bacterium]